MNKQETKRCIAVMQAYVDGREIMNVNVHSGCAAWASNDPQWNWGNNPGSYYSTTLDAEQLISKLHMEINEQSAEIHRLQGLLKGGSV